MGLRGFILIMYFSNLLTCFLNVGRLLKVSRAKLFILKELFLPLVSALCITLLADTALALLGNLNSLVYIILLCTITLPIYVLLLFLFGIVKPDDIRNFLR